MSETGRATEESNELGYYEIRLKGHLEDRWAAWLEGLRVTHESDGTTILVGQVVDQAALYGLLRKVRDLGLPLIAVNQLERKQADRPDVNANADHNYSNKETKL